MYVVPTHPEHTCIHTQTRAFTDVRFSFRKRWRRMSLSARYIRLEHL